MLIKRILLVSVAILLVGAFVLAGCAKPATAPTSQEPIELKFAYWFPPVSPPGSRAIEPWGDVIEKATNGRVKITFYGGETLGKAPDHYDLCLKRTADITAIDPSFTPGVFPLCEAITLPMQFPSSEVAAEVWWDLMEKYMAKAECSKVKVLWVYPTATFQMMTRTKQVRTLEDLKGMKFSATSPMLAKTTEALGAVPVVMAEPDIYTSLERGLIDGRWCDWECAWTWKAYEVTKYRTDNIGLGVNTNIVVMNLDSWNSLPPDIQKIIDENTGFDKSRSCGAMFEALPDEFLPKLLDYDQKAGNPEIYSLPESERERWVEAVGPVCDDWANDMEAKGLPGKQVLEDLRSLVKKYS